MEEHRLVRIDGYTHGNRGIDRALRNGIAPEATVLSIPPGSLQAPELLRPNRPFLDAAAARDTHINQEIASPPIVNNCLEVGIVKGGIAQLALTQVEIMREERLD